jgi:hypothetical protein
VVLRRVFMFLVVADAVPSSLILSTLMIEAIRYSETLVLRRGTQRHIPDDGILHSHRRGNLNSYKRSRIRLLIKHCHVLIAITTV